MIFCVSAVALYHEEADDGAFCAGVARVLG
jgi:hypothetical protein